MTDFWRLRQWCYLTGGVRDTISDVNGGALNPNKTEDLSKYYPEEMLGSWDI